MRGRLICYSRHGEGSGRDVLAEIPSFYVGFPFQREEFLRHVEGGARCAPPHVCARARPRSSRVRVFDQPTDGWCAEGASSFFYKPSCCW